MVIAGAGGHAKEIIDLLSEKEKSQAVLFDNRSENPPNSISNIPLISTIDKLIREFNKDARFIIGVGNPQVRKKIYDIMMINGGVPYTIKSNDSYVSDNNTNISEGCNLMRFAFISNNVKIGRGTLINARANIHHDVKIGDFSEVAPAAIILGGVEIGDYSFIGAGAIILPGIKIKDNVCIGAGAVVTRDVDSFKKIKGVPAR